MVKYDISFMKDWDNLNSFEINGVKILDEGMKLIFESIPKENITAIYLKGSFLRREMNVKSDVDVTVIVNDEKYLSVLNELQNKIGNSKKLNFGFGGHSIEELKTGKVSKLGKGLRTGPARVTRLIPTYKLIYGEELDLKSLYKKTDLVLFIKLIETFNNVFFPAYEKNEIDFQMLLKQTLWLLELETAVKNQNFKFKSWNDLLNYFDDTHLIHEVLKLRGSNEKNEKIQKLFILRLKSYIDKLGVKYDN